MEIIAQILSIISCAIMIYSFQLKNNRNLFIVQTISGIGFAISYGLLGAFTGCAINIVAFTNAGVLFLGRKFRKLPILILICLAFALITVFTYQGFLDFVVAAAQIIATLSMWKDDGKIIRFTRLFIASPAWLVYNIVVFSLGGIICEVFNICSIIVSFFRYGKDGFEK